jgi:hypothetical protein
VSIAFELHHQGVVMQRNACSRCRRKLLAQLPPYPLDVLEDQSAGTGYARHERARRVTDRRFTGRAEA